METLRYLLYTYFLHAGRKITKKAYDLLLNIHVQNNNTCASFVVDKSQGVGDNDLFRASKGLVNFSLMTG